MQAGGKAVWGGAGTVGVKLTHIGATGRGRRQHELPESYPKYKEQRPAFLRAVVFTGVPTGIRTPVTAVKGRCPRPLDDGDFLIVVVEVSGIEPLTSCMPCKRSPS